MNIKFYAAAIAILLLTASCNQRGTTNKSAATSRQDTTAPVVQPINTTYRYLTDKDSIKKLEREYGAQLGIILSVNRTDTQHIAKMDTVLIPADLSADVARYSPFPQSIPYANIRKVIYFSYPAQYFAAYQNGQLVRSGPTNMGRKKDPTPTGLFFTNWKGESVKSTSNDEWILKWNFNVINDSGIGFHQYDLPGYPASHSCLRLQMDDAKYLYTFADEWKLQGKQHVVAKGTPVIIFGEYPFGGRKPWLQLAENPHASEISVADIKQLTDPHVEEILAAQRGRDSVGAH